MRAANVYPIEVSDATVALGDIDVLKLDVHVVFRFDEFAAVCLARIDLNRHLVALRIVPSAVKVL